MKATHNFKLTLAELNKFLKIPIQNDRDIAGIIQAFEFTFEQCWKSIQKISQDHGVEIASPKMAFTFALQNKWINQQDESRWLQLLKDRNLLTRPKVFGLNQAAYFVFS
ncbi:MAG: nucleotidyltransferase substrate binding protein [Pseudobdellovibrio sp.]